MTFPQANAAGTTIVNSLDPTGWRDRAIDNRSSPAAKVALFRSLFRGREDVQARRFESQSDRSGYQPDCANEPLVRTISALYLGFFARDVGISAGQRNLCHEGCDTAGAAQPVASAGVISESGILLGSSDAVTRLRQTQNHFVRNPSHISLSRFASRRCSNVLDAIERAVISCRRGD